MTKKSIGTKPLPLPAPAWVIGSYDTEGKPNIMTSAWAGICCSKPVCVNISLRKATYSYGNIVNRKAFTVNVPSMLQMRLVDYAGIASGRDVNKFEHTGLTAMHSSLVDAPYAEEFPLIMECKLIQTIDLGLHTMFIGEVMDIQVNEDLLDAEGKLLIEKMDMIAYSGGQYFRLGEVGGKAFSVGKEI